MTADQLKDRRQRMGLTQRGMADALGVALGTYRDWEQTEHKPAGRLLELALSGIEGGLRYAVGDYERIRPRKAQPA